MRDAKLFDQADRLAIMNWVKDVLRRRGIDPSGMTAVDMAKAISHMRMDKNSAWEYLANYRRKALAQIRHPQQPPKPVDSFYSSDDWLKLRYEALKIHKGRCMVCGRSAKEDGVQLQVDHIKPVSKYPTLRLLIDNVQVMCADCNKGKGNWDETDWR